MKAKFQSSMYDELQRRRDYLAAIDRALPDDDDDQDSFNIQEGFSEVMWWVFGTAVVLAIIGLAAFSVGMTKP